MNGLCNTSLLLCTRCQSNPRLPKQRWCRQCLTSAQRQRRTAQRAGQADDATSPVTHAPTQAMTCLTQAQQQALEAYWNAVQEYTARQTPKPGRLPMVDRSSIIVTLQLRVEAAKQRCLALGINPESGSYGLTTPRSK